jgi:hypothetical protein
MRAQLHIGEANGGALDKSHYIFLVLRRRSVRKTKQTEQHKEKTHHHHNGLHIYSYQQ